MSNQDIPLMAHLLRRAGFGATRDELERYSAEGYEATVEELLNPRDPGDMPDDIIRRYHVQADEAPASAAQRWLYRMITTRCPLEEKLTLFWHGLFATAYGKGNQARTQLNQIDTFRRHAFGAFPVLLAELSKDPAMLFWLDNVENHKGAINENYGRELLELFSMGIGNYTEDDIKGCARAFTGWTIANIDYMTMKARKDSFSPYGRIAWHFEYRPDDHDEGEKTFLGETGRFKGEDIVDIIARQPSTAQFISTRLFQSFAADEVSEEGERVIEAMVNSYFESKYEIRSVLRTLFNCEYFKSEAARFARVKSPVELVVGAVRLARDMRTPTLEIVAIAAATDYMGQTLLVPPDVSGWKEGGEWINGGAVMERVNFVAEEIGDVSKPGVGDIVERLAARDGGTLSPDELVNGCLDLLGPILVSEETRTALVAHVAQDGELDLRGRRQGDEAEQRVGEVLGMIASAPEFQFA